MLLLAGLSHNNPIKYIEVQGGNVIKCVKLHDIYAQCCTLMKNPNASQQAGFISRQVTEAKIGVSVSSLGYSAVKTAELGIILTPLV